MTRPSEPRSASVSSARPPRRLSRDAHTIAWTEAGNPHGAPVVVLHGGPGSGCRPAVLRLFDLARMRVVLVDQRGAGASTPRGGLRHNDTMRLIGDLDALRAQLGIERWGVVGGSWGASLALAYAGQHPSRVTGVVLRGVFLTSSREVRALFVGARARAPREWLRLTAAAGTNDFTPSSRYPLGVRTAVVFRRVGSNSGCGSAMATQACGTFSPANSFR